MTMTLEFDTAERANLVAALEEVFADPAAGELRLELPRNWMIFWKQRESGSRMLLAHPEPEEWVATLALEAQFGQNLITALRELASGQRLLVGELGELVAFSNLELELLLR